MFRPILGQYSGISIQKRYKGRCSKNARCDLFAVAIFIMFKYKSIITIRPKKSSLFCDKHNELASINITTNLFFTLNANNIYIFYLYNMQKKVQGK